MAGAASSPLPLTRHRYAPKPLCSLQLKQQIHGKVEYVPELKLWVGIYDSTHELAAADLSSMNSQPQLLSTCKEFEPPEEWKRCRDPQLVNLGLGKFCVARFFRNQAPKRDSDDEFIGRNITVLTGVEVMQSACHGKVELQMIPHRSRWYGGDTIQCAEPLCHKSSRVDGMRNGIEERRTLLF